MQLIDLSHVIEHGMTTYPGLPGPEISAHMTFDDSASHYSEGTEFSIGAMRLVANTGTYLDTAAHRYRHGDDLSALPLERCALLPGAVVDGGPEFCPSDFDHRALEGRAVLLRTGWDRHWASETYADPSHPFLSEAGARRLVDLAVALVGIDSVNIDDTRGGDPPGALGPAGRPDSRRRAPRRAARPPPGGIPVHGGAAGRARNGHVPGAGVRGPRLTSPPTVHRRGQRP